MSNVLKKITFSHPFFFQAKHSLSKTLIIPLGFLVSCSSIGEKKNTISQNKVSQKSLTQKQIRPNPFKNMVIDDDGPGGYSHELAEADADDIQIKTELGSQIEVDEEISSTPQHSAKRISEKKSLTQELSQEKSKKEVSSTHQLSQKNKSHGPPKIEAPSFLTPKNTQRKKFWIEYFTKKNRDRFQRFIDNGENYRPIIEKILEQEGVPKELYYVGLIESGYYLGARSHARAVGPWQFIKGTGKRYGLRITSEVDERRDLFKSTRAAAQYFMDLYNVFSSWELALAAYNAGEFGIMRRIMKYGTRDFYQLSKKKALPSETINYVPKVLAAMEILSDPQKFGFTLSRRPIFDHTVLKSVNKNTRLSILARRLRIPKKTLATLNPELKRGKTPRYYPYSKYSLRIPGNSNEKTVYFAPSNQKPSKNYAHSSRKKRGTTKKVTHRVRRGENLTLIARKYKTSVRKIAKLNGIKNTRRPLFVGKRLIVRSPSSSSGRHNVKVLKQALKYRVQRGDNLTEIAELFNVRLSQLKRVNRLKSSRIFVGQYLKIPKSKKAIYTVKKGDYLVKLSQKFDLSLNALMKLNSLKKKSIYPGQKLIVKMD